MAVLVDPGDEVAMVTKLSEELSVRDFAMSSLEILIYLSQQSHNQVREHFDRR